MYRGINFWCRLDCRDKHQFPSATVITEYFWDNNPLSWYFSNTHQIPTRGIIFSLYLYLPTFYRDYGIEWSLIDSCRNGWSQNNSFIIINLVWAWSFTFYLYLLCSFVSLMPSKIKVTILALILLGRYKKILSFGLVG